MCNYRQIINDIQRKEKKTFLFFSIWVRALTEQSVVIYPTTKRMASTTKKTPTRLSAKGKSPLPRSKLVYIEECYENERFVPGKTGWRATRKGTHLHGADPDKWSTWNNFKRYPCLLLLLLLLEHTHSLSVTSLDLYVCLFFSFF